MGLLQKIKSLFGSDQSSQSSRGGEPDVTVEREPSAESEHAVKGTGGADRQTGGQADQPTDTTASTAEPEPTASEAVEDAEPAPETESATDAEPATDTEPAETPAEGDTDTGETAETVEVDEAEEAEEAEAGEDAEDTGETEKAEESPSLDEIKGIGPTYADRLSDAGYESVADLAAADAAAVAEAAQTGEGRASDWIERARNF